MKVKIRYRVIPMDSPGMFFEKIRIKAKLESRHDIDCLIKQLEGLK